MINFERAFQSVRKEYRETGHVSFLNGANAVLSGLGVVGGIGQSVSSIQSFNKMRSSLKSKSGLYRKIQNTGEFKDLEELMQLKHVKNVANEAGIGLDGIKVKIDRNSELLGKGVYGYTDGKTITLYPDAFANTETLVKTLGHERMHVYQVGVFGKPTSTDMLGDFERGASMSEQSWWDYFNSKNGGQK